MKSISMSFCINKILYGFVAFLQKGVHFSYELKTAKIIRFTEKIHLFTEFGWISLVDWVMFVSKLFIFKTKTYGNKQQIA
jgi:hypothetical protein